MTPSKLSIVGSSGAGKSTLGRRIAAKLGIPHLELDAVYHQAHWTPLEDAEFRRRVTTFMEQHPHWVIDGNYRAVQSLVWARASQVVWLDLPRRQSMVRLLWRTLKGGVTREELWNGNTERPMQIFDPNPEENVVLWAWKRHDAQQKAYTTAMTDPQWHPLRFHRLRTQRAVERFVDQLESV